MKTYPYTENDENSVVDITKVFIESFENLGGRCDVNTDGVNILNARPTNFNLFNQVYNQENNIFKYYILDEKFDVNEYSNQIAWSLTKTPNDDVDAWTNISLASLFGIPLQAPLSSVIFVTCAFSNLVFNAWNSV